MTLDEARRAHLGSGIYAVVCLKTNSLYVGHSRALSNRADLHFLTLRKGTHPNHKLQSSCDRYGFKSHFFVVLEESSRPKSQLKFLEQKWMDDLSFNGWALFNLTRPEIVRVPRGIGFTSIRISREVWNRLKDLQFLHWKRTGSWVSQEATLVGMLSLADKSAPDLVTASIRESGVPNKIAEKKAS